MSTLEDIRQRALNLRIEERAALAEELLASLEELSETEAAQLWEDEAQRRLELYREGRAQAVPEDQLHAKVEKLIGG